MVKKEGDEGFVEQEVEMLRKREREMEGKVRKGIEKGSEMVEAETEEFKKQVRRHPIEYVAGAFIVGLVIGKLMK